LVLLFFFMLNWSFNMTLYVGLFIVAMIWWTMTNLLMITCNW
jgi:hypothetical protein